MNFFNIQLPYLSRLGRPLRKRLVMRRRRNRTPGPFVFSYEPTKEELLDWHKRHPGRGVVFNMSDASKWGFREDPQLEMAEMDRGNYLTHDQFFNGLRAKIRANRSGSDC